MIWEPRLETERDEAFPADLISCVESCLEPPMLRFHVASDASHLSSTALTFAGGFSGSEIESFEPYFETYEATPLEDRDPRATGGVYYEDFHSKAAKFNVKNGSKLEVWWKDEKSGEFGMYRCLYKFDKQSKRSCVVSSRYDNSYFSGEIPLSLTRDEWQLVRRSCAKDGLVGKCKNCRLQRNKPCQQCG